MRHSLPLAIIFSFLFGSQASAIVIGGDFAADYTATSLGSVPGLPTRYGGLTLLPGDPDTLLIGGRANSSAGRLHTIGVTRGAGNHITGFSGSAMPFGNVGEFNDGGVVFGPDGVLFTARWPANALGQTKPGNLDEDRVDNLGSLGISGSSISALNFVPAGFPGAGQMKVVSWPSGNWYTVNFAPDGMGTFMLNSATLETSITGGPEGFVYIDPINPGFSTFSVLVSDFSADRISAYEINSNGDPIISTRRDFLTGIDGAEGASIDPLTGDFLFSTFGGGNQVVVVQGFEATVPPPGVPEPGSLFLVFVGLGLIAHTRARRLRATVNRKRPVEA